MKADRREGREETKDYLSQDTPQARKDTIYCAATNAKVSAETGGDRGGRAQDRETAESSSTAKGYVMCHNQGGIPKQTISNVTQEVRVW